MPGPVSDAYDPTYGTSGNRVLVYEAIQEVIDRITTLLGERLVNIVQIADGEDGGQYQLLFSERELRLIRYALRVTTEQD